MTDGSWKLFGNTQEALDPQKRPKLGRGEASQAKGVAWGKASRIHGRGVVALEQSEARGQQGAQRGLAKEHGMGAAGPG